MQLFGGGDEFAKKKDIVNPNLLDKSKSFIMHTPAGYADCGKFIQYSKQNAGSIYLSQIQINSGIIDQGTTYFSCEPNTYYTQSLWFTSSVKLTIPTLENNQVQFVTNQNISTDTINQKIISLGNNQYKIIGSFYSGTTINNFDICYITNFHNIINADASIRFDALKIEKGTNATPWCPAIEDYAMKSDLDNKVNTDRSLYFLKEGTSPLTESEIFNTDDGQGRLQAIHQRIPENGTETFGRYDNLLLFGGDNITSIFDVDTFNNQVKVATGDAQGKAAWSEFIAWKSDIQRLEQEIADLKKQIGGK